MTAHCPFVLEHGGFSFFFFYFSSGQTSSNHISLPSCIQLKKNQNNNNNKTPKPVESPFKTKSNLTSHLSHCHPVRTPLASGVGIPSLLSSLYFHSSAVFSDVVRINLLNLFTCIPTSAQGLIMTLWPMTVKYFLTKASKILTGHPTQAMLLALSLTYQAHKHIS